MFARLSPVAWLLAAGFAVLSGLLVATFSTTSLQHREAAAVAHTLEVVNRLTTVLSLLQDAETGQRGFIITGDQRYLEPYEHALANLDREVLELAEATGDSPAHQAAIARLRRTIAARLELLADVLEVRRNEGTLAAAAVINQGRGRALMDDLRRQIGEMRTDEAQLLTERQARAAATASRLQALQTAGIVVLVLLTGLAVREQAQRLGEARQAAAALEDANARLKAEAETREKAEAQVRQMQKLQAIGQLTGGIAHDFNNMLSIVIGSLELGRRRLRGEPERAEICIDNAMEGAQRAANLTARLLAFSRQTPLAPVATDPNKLVGGMSELLRRTIGEQLSVETVLAGGVWRINVDPPQLENAILNLCVNGRDAMPDGGKLTIETGNAYLDEAYAVSHREVTPGQYVLIAVTDTGVGMAPEVIDRAFDPFFTTKGVGQGTGLGLSQVFGFVKQSGGHVKIYSEVGRGTSVKIYLPRWAGEATSPPETVSTESLPRAQGTEIVLVVEDEEKVRHMAVDALRELGYTVVQASSAERALEALTLQPRIDLLFTDIVMPGMTGRALADRIAGERPDLKVLYTTGYTRNAVVHNGVLDPGVAFLPKPFTLEELARKVRQVLDTGGFNRPV